MQDIENEFWRIRREVEDNRNESISDLRRFDARIEAILADMNRTIAGLQSQIDDLHKLVK
jgi:prefoldin subunit 5